MLYHFLSQAFSEHTVSNLFRYITFRSFIAFVLASVISILWGKKFIAFMKKMQFGQVVRSEGPETHLKKAGTPTMGGIVILGAVFLTFLITGNFNSAPALVVAGVGLSYFLLGLTDDYLKVLKKNTDGVSAKGKLLWQAVTAAIAGYVLIKLGVITTELYIPFFKEPVADLGYFYIVFIMIVIVGSSNAVNLTDGLDGLVIGPVIISCATLGFLAYVAGHSELSSYLLIPNIPGAGELSIITAATIGAGVGFLWYNSYPAQMFMGDVGSLPLGGILGTIAVCTKNEFLFALIGGIFVIEAISVILQVGSYKYRKKRIFKMAPIHHHFELLGWSENKVIVRFWIISLVLSILALATLKIR